MSTRRFKWAVASLTPILLVAPLWALNHNIQKAQLKQEVQRLTFPHPLRTSADGDIDVTGRTSSGEPLLCLAARKHDLKAAKLLVKAGANLEQGDRDGNTALIVAAKHESPEVLALLVSSGANVNARNDLGESALSLLEDSFKQSIEIGAMAAQLRAAGARSRWGHAGI